MAVSAHLAAQIACTQNRVNLAGSQQRFEFRGEVDGTVRDVRVSNAQYQHHFSNKLQQLNGPGDE
jgi:hypothetical protein